MSATELSAIQAMTMSVCPMMYCGVPKKRAARSAARPKGSSPKALCSDTTNEGRSSGGQCRQLFLFQIAHRLEGAAVDARWSTLTHDLGMARRDVPDMRGEAVMREERVHPPHKTVTRHLGDDRGRGDRGALLVTVDDRAVGRRRRAKAEAVDETCFGRRRQRVQDLAHRREVRFVQAVAIDRAVRNHPHDHLLRAAQHRVEQLFATLRRALLRVVEIPERSHLVVAQAAVVEQHAGHHQRPRQAAATSLVGSRDQPGAEPPVELQELLAGARRHGAEDSRPLGGLCRGLGGNVAEAPLAVPPWRRDGLCPCLRFTPSLGPLTAYASGSLWVSATSAAGAPLDARTTSWRNSRMRAFLPTFPRR